VKCCASCDWFDASFAPDDDPTFHIGTCNWPAALLPISLRFANRERTCPSPVDGADCPQWREVLPSGPFSDWPQRKEQP
jgi:hypothetical protein